MKRTATQLIYAAMRHIGYIRAGVTPSPESLADGLDALNEMLDSWNIDRLKIIALQREVFDMIPHERAQTIGPGDDYDTIRPPAIEAAGVITPANAELEIPMRIITVKQYAEIPLKDIGSPYPAKLYYDACGVIYLYPVPDDENQIALYTWRQLSSFRALTASVTFKPGYVEAIQYNLAVNLAPRMAIVLKAANPMHALVMQRASETRRAIEHLNLPAELMKADPAVLSGSGRGWNWRTGGNR